MVKETFEDLTTFECNYRIFMNKEKTEVLKMTVGTDMKVREFVFLALEMNNIDADLVIISCLYNFKGDELTYESEEYDEGLLFDHHGKGVEGGHVIIEVNDYLDGEGSDGDDSNGTTAESENDDDDGNDSDKSKDGQDKSGDGSKGGGGYGDAPASSSGINPVPIKEFVENSDLDNLREKQKGIKQNLLNLKGDYDLIKEKIKELEKVENERLSKERQKERTKEQKVRDAEDRAEHITINVRPSSADIPNFTVSVKKGDPMKMLKLRVMNNIHGDIGEKKLMSKAKNFTWNINNKVVEHTNAHHKTTVRRFPVADGEVLNLSAVARGGGKRGATPTETSIIFAPSALPSDLDIVKEGIAITAVDMEGWVRSLDDDNLTKLMEVLDEQKKQAKPGQISSLTSPYLQFVREYAHLTETWKQYF